MATSIADLNIRIGANTRGLATGIQQAQGMLQGFQASVAGMVAQAAAAFGGLSAAGFVGFGLKLAADVERTEAAFQVFTGSAEKAKQVMADLREQAVANPLFDFANFTDAAFSLLAMGTSVDVVNDRVRVLADVSAASRQPLKELAVVFSQVQQAGRLTGGELRQFNERGVPVLQQLAAMLAVDTIRIREMTEAGQISADMVTLAFERMTAAGGIYDGMSAKIAATSYGSFAKLSESATMLATTIGTALLPVAQNIVNALQQVVDTLNAMDAETIRSVAQWAALAVGIGAAIAIAPRLIAAVGMIVNAIKALTSAQIIAQAFSGPKGWATLAAGAVIAAATVYGVSAAFDTTAKSIEATTAAADKNAKSIGEIDKQAQAMQAATVAAAEAQKQHEKLASYAAQLTQSLRTPWEIATEEISKAREAFDAGVLLLETYDRAVQKIAETYHEAIAAKMELEKPVGTGAVTRFSQAGFSASVTGERMTAHLAKIVALQQQANAQLNTIANKPAVTVRKVTL